jgi:hypothetical protein
VKGVLTTLRDIVIEKTRDNMDWHLKVSVDRAARPSLSNKELSSKEAEETIGVAFGKWRVNSQKIGNNVKADDSGRS